MTEKEKLQALHAIDDFLCEDDENFDKNDSQLPTDDTHTSGNIVS